MPQGVPPQVPGSGTDRIIKVVLIYAVFAALWILLSDKAVEQIFNEPEMITLASTLKGWLFVAVTSLLLYGLMRRLPGGAATEPKHPSEAGLRPLLPLALIAVAIMTLTAISIIHALRQEKNKGVDYLLAIADLRAGQISDWLRERNGDMHLAQSSTFFVESYRGWTHGGDASSGEALKKRLNEYREDRFFQSVLLLDEHNRVLWSSEGPAPVLGKVLESMARLAKTEGKSVRVGPYRDDDGMVRLDLIAPLLLAGPPPWPAVVLRLDPETYLFPTLRTWPVPSASGETMLFRRDGDEVLFLGELRHRKDTAAVLRIPVADKDLLAAKVLRGEVKPGSPVRGLDYRGVPIVGVVRAISGTDWFLAAKVDQAEFHVEAIRDALWIALTGLLALFMAAAGFFLYRQRQELAFSLRVRETQAERLRALHLLDAISEGSGDVIFAKDRDGRYLLFNRDAALVTGKRADEVLGRDDFALFSPEQAASIIALDRQVMGEDRTVTFQEDLATASDKITFLSTKGPLHDAEGNVIGIFGVSRDITERIRAEEALREAKTRLENTLESISDAFFSMDDNLVVTYFNAAAERMLNRKAAEVIGKHLFDAFPETRGSIFEEKYRQALLDKVPMAFETYFDIDPYRNWYDVRVYPRGNGISVYFQVITERKRAEEERKRLEERLQRAERMEALGTLAGGVAHDLNNVLGIVVGYSEMLLYDLDASSPLKSQALAILNGGQRAASIVQDLLTLARRGVPTRKVLNLNRVLMDSQKSPEFEKLISFHPKVRIRIDFEPDLLNIAGSSVHLEKSFFNLVSNAAEAMAEGGLITVRTRNRYLDRPVSGYDEVKEGDYVVLSVSDDGEGIPPADLKHIFEPFYTKKVMGRSGTGLGLAVVWGTVKDHCGYINVESEVGKGTTFTLYFPITRGEITPERTSIPASEYMGRGERVLVVDDVKEQRDLAAAMLGKMNYAVTCVSSGEEAVEYLRRHSVDLVVLDMIMDPGIDGLDTYASISKIHPGLKAIIVSGFAETERVRKTQSMGAGAYVKKPYVLEKLALAVRKELDRVP